MFHYVGIFSCEQKSSSSQLCFVSSPLHILSHAYTRVYFLLMLHVFPTQVSGIDPETPYQQIKTLLAGLDSESEEIGGDKDPLVVDALRIDRTAVIKFKKANDVSDFHFHFLTMTNFFDDLSPLYFTLLCSTPFDSAQSYPTLPYSTLLHSILLYFILYPLLHSILLSFTRSHSSLLFSPLSIIYWSLLSLLPSCLTRCVVTNEVEPEHTYARFVHRWK